MCSYEDDRIRHKNKKWDDLTKSDPILYPSGGSYEENSDDAYISSDIGAGAAEKHRGEDADDRSDRYWDR